MSVIAARVYPDRIVVASDSIIVKGWSKTNKNFLKLEAINGMIVGCSGSVQEVSLMWHYMETHRPLNASTKDVLDFFIEFSSWKNEKGFGVAVENEYLMAYRGRLYEVCDMAVFEIHDHTAIGAGEDFANAALHLDHTPREAVQVACDLSCFVCEPIIELTQMKNT